LVDVGFGVGAGIGFGFGFICAQIDTEILSYENNLVFEDHKITKIQIILS
jgi:hypothetical protein